MNEESNGNLNVSKRLKEFGNFTMVPNSIIKHKGLSSNEVRLWIVLYSYFYQNNKIYPGMKKLADDMNCSEDTVLRARKKLESLGLVSVSRRGYKQTNEYTLDIPSEDNSDPASLRVGDTASLRDKEDRVFNNTETLKEKENWNKRKRKNSGKTPSRGSAASPSNKSIFIEKSKQDTVSYLLEDT